MATWAWVLMCIGCGFMGFLAAALCAVGSAADDWAEGYWAGRLWRDSVKYHNEHKDDEVNDGIS